MKKLLSLALACLLLFSLSACGREPKEEVSDEKPVIYLYPEQETDVRVTLDLAPIPPTVTAGASAPRRMAR